MTWLDDLAEASRSAFWSKPGRLKPGEVPRPWPWPAEPSETDLNKGTNTMTHPLDNAITWSNIIMFDLKDSTITNTDILSYAAQAAAGLISTNPRTRKDNLRQLASTTSDWLFCLEIDDPWQTMRDEYDRAKAKHGDMTLDSDKPTDEQRYCAVIEEIGEIARALTYDQDHAGELTNEITQLGALALAWLARELEKEKDR